MSRTRQQPEQQPGSPGSSTTIWVVIAALVVVVALVAALALVVRGGEEDDAAASPGTAAPAASGSSDPDTAVEATGNGATGNGATGPGPVVGEQLPVTPTGDPLPPYDRALDPDPAVGMTAPVVDGQAFDGTPLTVGGPGDGPTMVVFLAHWCPHCNAEIPELNQLRDDGALPAELDVIGVATGTRADAPNYPPSRWATDKDWTWPMLADDENSLALAFYGGTSFPFTVLLDADGTVLARKAGESSASATLEWIESTLAAA